MRDIRTIGVFAPGSYNDPESLDKSIEIIKRFLPFEFYVHPQSYARLDNTQIASPAEYKVRAFHELLDNGSVDAIMASRGGNSGIEMLDKIDYGLVHQHAKPLIGFSDVTALLCALFNHAGVHGLHAPVVMTLAHGQNSQTNIDSLTDTLNGALSHYRLDDVNAVREGTCEGRMIAGNLSVLDALYGTAYLPDLKNTILMIEDCGMEYSALDRMFSSWRLRGVFDDIAGLIFSDFVDMRDSGRPYGLDTDALINKHFHDTNIPVITNAPFGHGARNLALPFGAQCRMEAGPDHCTLHFTP